MRYFKKLKHAIAWVETRNKFSPKKDLNRIKHAAEALNIQNDFRMIHVAGTNGKGSTSCFISSILIENGLKVGTFMSPYLIRFNERIRFNMEEISDEKLLDYLNFMYGFNESFSASYGESLVFFEIITLVALIYFNDMNCDCIVMEVGIGGLLDATNILNYDVSVITNIGFDHMKQLGNSLEDIALNKLGILKPKNHLITYVDQSLVELFKKVIKKENATAQFLYNEHFVIKNEHPLIFDYQNNEYMVALNGDFQAKNAIIAINAIKHLYPNIDLSVIKEGLRQASNPGRFEVINNNPLTIIDGAHNTHGISALCAAFKNYTNKRVWIIFCALKDKNPAEMIKILKTISSNIVITSFADPRVMSVAELIVNDSELTYIGDIKRAYQFVKKAKAKNDVILITGSIHFIGYVRNTLKVKQTKTSTI